MAPFTCVELLSVVTFIIATMRVPIVARWGMPYSIPSAGRERDPASPDALFEGVPRPPWRPVCILPRPVIRPIMIDGLGNSRGPDREFPAEPMLLFASARFRNPHKGFGE